MRRIRNPVYGFFRTVGSNPTPSASSRTMSDGARKGPFVLAEGVGEKPPGFGERQSGGLSLTTPAQRAGGPGAKRRDERIAARRSASNPTRPCALPVNELAGPSPLCAALSCSSALHDSACCGFTRNPSGLDAFRVSASCKRRSLPSAH